MAQDKQADDRRKAREDAKKLAAQGVAERREAHEEARAHSDRQRGGGQPTPTQEENDLAKVGALDIDAKEDDGSGPDRATVNQTRVAAPMSRPAPYTTRTVGSSPASTASTDKPKV